MCRLIVNAVLVWVLSGSFVLAQAVVPAQTPSGSGALGYDALTQHAETTIVSPLTQPTVSPGAILLMELEGRFSQAVLAGGGKVFAQWFADDGMTLNNGKLAVIGKTAIAAHAQWDPKDYQLSWVPDGAQMGPSNDMGFTWGRYEGHSKDKNGEPVVTSGRYMTVWKKMQDGSWKVALDASADEPAEGGSCCVLPKP